MIDKNKFKIGFFKISEKIGNDELNIKNFENFFRHLILKFNYKNFYCITTFTKNPKSILNNKFNIFLNDYNWMGKQQKQFIYNIPLIIKNNKFNELFIEDIEKNKKYKNLIDSFQYENYIKLENCINNYISELDYFSMNKEIIMNKVILNYIEYHEIYNIPFNI